MVSSSDRSKAAEERYVELMRGFVEPYRSRLPLIYHVYGDDLPGLVATLRATSGRTEKVSFTGFQEKVEVASVALNELMDAVGMSVQTTARAPEWEEAQRDLVRSLLEPADAAYGALVEEYFFLTNIVELLTLVRNRLRSRSATAEDEREAAHDVETLGSTVVELFQELARVYEAIQMQVARILR